MPSPKTPVSAAGVWLLGGDLPISRYGYGAMRLCGQPGNFGPYAHWHEGERLLRRVLDLGITFIDTAEAYGPGWNEQLIASALHPYPPNLVIGTKGGVTKRSPDQIFPDGRPHALRRSCEASLRRLKLERLDLYQWHRPDPEVRFEESVEELAQLRQEGKIRHLGLSNVSVEQIAAARAIVPIASVQNRFNLAEQAGRDVLDYCVVHGLAFFPYAPLGAHPLKPGAPLAHQPRTEAGLGAAADSTLSPPGGSPLETVAAECQATPAQVALAWLLRLARNVVVIPGTTSLLHLEEGAGAARLQLTDAQCALLNAAPEPVSV